MLFVDGFARMSGPYFLTEPGMPALFKREVSGQLPSVLMGARLPSSLFLDSGSEFDKPEFVKLLDYHLIRRVWMLVGSPQQDRAVERRITTTLARNVVMPGVSSLDRRHTVTACKTFLGQIVSSSKR